MYAPKKYLWVLSAIIVFSSSCNAEVKPEVKELSFQPERILVVGNSYMYYNCGINGYLSGLIRVAVNSKIKTRIATIGRSNMSQQPIEEYLDNSKLESHDDRFGSLSEDLLNSEIKKRESYDLVLMQGSNRGEKDQARDAHYLKIHAEAIRSNGGTPALIMTWVQEKKDAPELSTVANALTKIANDNSMMVIPVGKAFELAKTRYPDWKLIMPDKTHPTALGSYLMASTIYAAIYKRDPLEATQFEGGCEKPIPVDLRKKAAKVALETVKDWYDR